MPAPSGATPVRIRSARLGLSCLALVLLLSSTTSRAVSFEVVSQSILTSPYALTTSNFTHDQAINGSEFTYTFGFDTYALDATVLPNQWLVDSILVFLGLNNSTELVGLSVAETLFSFSTTLRLTGSPGERAAISYAPYISGEYMQAYGAAPGGEVRSRIWLDYWINGPGISGREDDGRNDSGLVGGASGSLSSSLARTHGFEMLVGELVNVSGEFGVRSSAEVEPACIEVCIPFTNICHQECVAGVGFSFAGTKGLGGLSLYADPVPAPEPGTLALLGLGLAGLGLSRMRKGKGPRLEPLLRQT